MKSRRAVTPRGRKAKLTPHEELYAAIGRFVLTWADLEVCLDMLLLTTMSKRKVFQRKFKLPHQLGDKLYFIRSQTQDIYSTHRAEIMEVLDGISMYADTRHDFVHGAIIDHYIEEGVITATLSRLLKPPRQALRKPVKVTAPEITEISDRISGFGDRLLDVTQALLDAIN